MACKFKLERFIRLDLVFAFATGDKLSLTDHRSNPRPLQLFRDGADFFFLILMKINLDF